jgi:hypothetical protein
MCNQRGRAGACVARDRAHARQRRAHATHHASTSRPRSSSRPSQRCRSRRAAPSARVSAASVAARTAACVPPSAASSARSSSATRSAAARCAAADASAPRRASHAAASDDEARASASASLRRARRLQAVNASAAFARSDASASADARSAASDSAFQSASAASAASRSAVAAASATDAAAQRRCSAPRGERAGVASSALSPSPQDGSSRAAWPFIAAARTQRRRAWPQRSTHARSTHAAARAERAPRFENDDDRVSPSRSETHFFSPRSMRLAAAAPLRWLPLRRTPPAQQQLGAALRCRGRAQHAAAAAAAAPPQEPPSPPPTAAEREARLAANQLRTAGALLSQLAPLVRTDAHAPSRLRDLAGERMYNSSSRRLYRELLWTAVRHWCAASGVRALGACVLCERMRACSRALCASTPAGGGWKRCLLRAASPWLPLRPHGWRATRRRRAACARAAAARGLWARWGRRRQTWRLRERRCRRSARCRCARRTSWQRRPGSETPAPRCAAAGAARAVRAQLRCSLTR